MSLAQFLGYNSSTESHLDQEPKGPNPISVGDQITLGSGTKLHSGRGPNGIWAGDIFAFKWVTEFFQFFQNWCLRFFSKFFQNWCLRIFPFSKLVPTNFFLFQNQRLQIFCTKPHLGLGQSHTWVRDQIALGSETKLHQGRETKLGFGLGSGIVLHLAYRSQNYESR